MNGPLFELILAIKRKCQSNEEKIQAELGLSPAQFNGLVVLDQDAEISGSEFAGRMALSPSRGSRVLNSLVSDQYVHVRPGTDDRRAVRLSLTPKGRRAKLAIAGRMEDCERRLSAGLGPANLTQVKNALERLVAVL